MASGTAALPRSHLTCPIGMHYLTTSFLVSSDRKPRSPVAQRDTRTSGAVASASLEWRGGRDGPEPAQHRAPGLRTRPRSGSVGTGAVLPVVVLSARALGAEVSVAAFLLSLIWIAQLLADLPAGALAARIGERRALVVGLRHRGAAAWSAAPRPQPRRPRRLAVSARRRLERLRAGPPGVPHRRGPGPHARPRPVHARRRQPDRHLHRAVHRRAGRRCTGASRAAYVVGFVSSSAALACVPARCATSRRRTTAGGVCRAARSAGVLAEHRRTLLTLGVGVLFIGGGPRLPDRPHPAVRRVHRPQRRPDQPRRRDRRRRRHAAVLPGRRRDGPVRPDLGGAAEHGRARGRDGPAAAGPLVRHAHRGGRRARAGERHGCRAGHDPRRGRLARRSARRSSSAAGG